MGYTMTYTLRAYQQEAVDEAIEHIKKRLSPCLLELATGCHSKGSMILMVDGTSKAVEDISIGEALMGPDSEPRNVIGLHSGIDRMFRITPTKGESFIVNGGHILSLYSTPRRNGNKPGYTEVSVYEYLEQTEHFKHIHKLQRFPIYIGSQEVPVDPWFLGVMLGDGCVTGSSNYSLCNPDMEIIEEVEAYLAKIGANARRKETNKNAETLIFRNYKWLENEMSLLGLHRASSGTKFVPDCYKFNSIHVRKMVLAGLIDTDGHMSNCGFDYVSKSERLADDVVWLCRSIGLAAYKKECMKSCQNNFTGIYYRVSISGNCEIIPCRVKRKKSPARRQIKNHLVTGFSVEEVGVGDYFGFQVDGDHLYLDASFTRHHNSGKSLIVSAIAKYLKSVAPGKRVLCIAPSRELVLQNHSKYVTWYKEPASIYCSSAGSKELRHQVIFASPLTAMKNIRIIAHLGVSGIIIDEAHGVTPTMLELIKQVQEYEVNGTKPNENVRVIGMTATPYRTGTGYIYAKDCTGENEILHDDSKARDPYYSRLLYRVSAGELVEQGYLTKPIIGETDDHYDTSKLETDRNGSFTAASVAKAFNGNTKTERIVNKVMSFAESRKGVMFFAATISHAEEIASYLPSHDVRVITGKLKKADREKFINDFKARRVKYLVNVDVLTTGFDAPHVDLIAILRATESPGLLQQIIGRSLRLCEGKEDALVLDYAENIERHGLENDIFTPEIKTNRKTGEGIEIQVECPACHAISMKKRRNDPIYEGVAHDRYGNFLVPGTERATRYDAEGNACEWDGEVMTMKVKDPSRKDEFGDIEELDLPMPAHYSRRCSNPEAFVIKGQPVRCEHRFLLKICPKCFAENDIAARHCTDCKERLVDPNSKLTDAAGFANVMMDGEIRRVKCYSAIYTPWIAKSSGNHSLKAEYRTEIGEVTAWHTMRQKWIFKKLAQINGADSELITSYDQCSDWNNSPREITIRKTEQNGYVKFEIKQVHYSERVGA